MNPSNVLTHPIPRRQVVAGLLAALSPGLRAVAAGAPPRPLPPPMLAREAPDAIDPAGWLVSEKYDGVRARWDGQSLSFRSGRELVAPAWFVAALPAGVALDGELWCGRGRFEQVVACARRTTALDAEWRQMGLMVFDLPCETGPFEQRQRRLMALLGPADRTAPSVARAVVQAAVADRAVLQRRLAAVVRAGGEGLMLHRADAPYLPGRSDSLLKLKPLYDADARVLAHVEGRGRLQGRLGALRVRNPDGIEFLLGTGLTDPQRERPPDIGSWVTYTYRGLTAAGVPRFASFLRVRGLP